MKSTIFLPKRIKVGYQNRSDTYTGQLAYVIYFDSKGVLRKETSWTSWRDKTIEPQEFDNTPMSGFVLNKKVGDYKSDWNHRQAYVRVYDPRNFEFEITIQNLLYILQNTSSIKGKGLEGDFVYGWDGKDLLLIPTSSPDYTEITNFSEMLDKPESIKTNALVLGGTYRTKQNEDWVYLGRFIKYNSNWYREESFGKPEGLHYFFRNKNNFETIKSLSNKVVKTISVEPVSNYAELMDELTHLTMFSPIDKSKDEYVLFSDTEINEMEQEFIKKYWSYTNIYITYNNEMLKSPLRINKYKDTYSFEYRKDSSFVIDSINTLIKGLTLQQIHDKLQFKKIKQYLVNGNLVTKH